MDSPQYILNQINTGIKMGMDSISNISEKINNTNLKKELLFQYDKYNEILNSVNTELKNYDEFPKELNPMQKASGWMMIEWNTITDKSDSNIAKMMLKGSNMGIIQGTKLLNDNPKTTENIKNILNNFITFQKDSVEQLRKYL